MSQNPTGNPQPDATADLTVNNQPLDAAAKARVEEALKNAVQNELSQSANPQGAVQGHGSITWSQ